MANIPVLEAVIPDPALAHVGHAHQGKVVRKALRTENTSSPEAVHVKRLMLASRVWTAERRVYTADYSQHAERVLLNAQSMQRLWHDHKHLGCEGTVI
jgi:hypothetical protein